MQALHSSLINNLWRRQLLLSIPLKTQEREREREQNMMSFLLSFVFPPESLFVKAMSVISFATLTQSGLSEIKGVNLQYSKFSNSSSTSQRISSKKIKIPSRQGMLLAYTPAFLACVASCGLFTDEGSRFVLVQSALTVHFFKRIFEVLFIHKYSGEMAVESMIPISISYCLSAVTMIYAQHETKGSPEPQFNLMHAGVGLFLVGICGNFYHHYLLSKLRERGEKEYKIPKGGLFNLVICAHYFFEVLGFIGISFTSQTVYAFSFTIGTIFYLMGRSYATRRWYLSKFENFPRKVKAMIPYVF